MKYFFIAFIAISTLSFSQLASAQQQINNDGANAGELQPQTQNVQNNAGNQQDNVLNINNNVGSSDLLQNVKVNELNVTGAPAIGSTTKATNNLFSWLVFGSGILLILLAPVLLYVRDIKRKGYYAPFNSNDALSDTMNASSQTEAETDTEAIEATNDEAKPEKESEETEEAEYDDNQEDTIKKNKSKNKSKKKSKRNKKK